MSLLRWITDCVMGKNEVPSGRVTMLLAWLGLVNASNPGGSSLSKMTSTLGVVCAVPSARSTPGSLGQSRGNWRGHIGVAHLHALVLHRKPGRVIQHRFAQRGARGHPAAGLVLRQAESTLSPPGDVGRATFRSPEKQQILFALGQLGRAWNIL